MCENYCGICLLNTAYWVFSVVLFQRLQPLWRQALEIISVDLGLESLLQTICIQSDNYWEKMKEYGVSTYYIFVDFTATYMTALTELGSSRL
jgi:hypothetical protein